ncbi:MAG: hypothetical protein PHU12_00025 [Candidatus Aenigmarchaeota archaeon]|nr:hypothetical protein [Candidatus Aenigmarchaeota archaeon]
MVDITKALESINKEWETIKQTKKSLEHIQSILPKIGNLQEGEWIYSGRNEIADTDKTENIGCFGKVTKCLEATHESIIVDTSKNYVIWYLTKSDAYKFAKSNDKVNGRGLLYTSFPQTFFVQEDARGSKIYVKGDEQIIIGEEKINEHIGNQLGGSIEKFLKDFKQKYPDSK